MSTEQTSPSEQVQVVHVTPLRLPNPAQDMAVRNLLINGDWKVIVEPSKLLEKDSPPVKKVQLTLPDQTEEERHLACHAAAMLAHTLAKQGVPMGANEFLIVGNNGRDGKNTMEVTMLESYKPNALLDVYTYASQDVQKTLTRR